MAVEAMSAVFSEGSGAGGGREKTAPEGRVGVRVKLSVLRRKPLGNDLLQGASSWTFCQARGRWDH